MGDAYSPGSIGVGAMIIFVAFILTAAICSSVVIETVEKLQEKSDSTSNDVQDDISKKVELKAAYIRSIGGNCKVTLFQHSGFNGWSAEFQVGDYLVEDFIAAGAVDNDASSIKIEEGCAVSLFDGPNFDGAWEVEFPSGDYDHAEMVDAGMVNDQLSSMKIKGFGLLIHLELAAGSPSIQAGDIQWSVGCQDNDGNFGLDSNSIVLSGSRLMDGKNTLGEDSDILPDEVITEDMMVSVEVDFVNCVPAVGERVTFGMYVEKGAHNHKILPFTKHEVGYDLIHQPW